MKYTKVNQGRIFLIRLEHGEIVHEEIEEFACRQSIHAAALIIIGGADQSSKLVVGPENGMAKPINPIEHILDNVHEIAGIGTLFPDEDGSPVLHMHMTCGRNDNTVTGCIRNGVKVWQIMEVVLFEFVDTNDKRVLDPELGFKLLNL